MSWIHLVVGEDAFDVNPTVCLDGAVAPVHRAYPGRCTLHLTNQKYQTAQRHRPYHRTITLEPAPPHSPPSVIADPPRPGHGHLRKTAAFFSPRSIDRLRFFHPASIFPHIVHGAPVILVVPHFHPDLSRSSSSFLAHIWISYRQRIESRFVLDSNKGNHSRIILPHFPRLSSKSFFFFFFFSREGIFLQRVEDSCVERASSMLGEEKTWDGKVVESTARLYSRNTRLEEVGQLEAS